MTKLFLFPYAGSLGLGYSQWVKKLKNNYDIVRIVYTDLKEDRRNYRCSSWDELVDLVYKKVANSITDDDYIFFGHSMGSRMEYELYSRLYQNNLPLPKRIIFSGCRKLSVKTKDPRECSEREFREEYISLGGISEEVLACEELADMAFEDLKMDVELLSQFQFVPVPMKCPVTIWNGNLDKISLKKEWEELLGCQVEWKLYMGKHFFIYDQEEEIIQELISYS
ncbi:thioesterase II family protein [[Clostridium] polysaccharolyticum]|uniref:Surfactin synthase thioesterase subunit n=1 Tax=[Clostridium] polysaccharolyticum TaxID=29364 RepID=A0A1H9YN54_9FIRM|nr:thioesterase domain-containing protein [[Clostridium] polysaccharolyticum]SES70403.1 Surfactin synthase thioesterase subunit [[Clostridium] polysaccharolyticum]